MGDEASSFLRGQGGGHRAERGTGRVSGDGVELG